jgi:hypothetical protein
VGCRSKLELARSLNIHGQIVYVGRNVCNPLRDIEDAICLCEESRRIAEECGDNDIIAEAENSLGLLYFEYANHLSGSSEEEAFQILMDKSLHYLQKAKNCFVA